MSTGAQTYTTESYFKRHWRGELSLPKSYWINGFLIWALGINLLCVAALTAALIALRGTAGLVIIVALAVMALQATAYLWALVGIWRSAVRYPGPKFWSILARVAIAIGVLISIKNILGDFTVIGRMAGG